MGETTHKHNLATEFDRIIIASEEENTPFTIAIIADVQTLVSEPYTEGKMDPFIGMVDWIVDNKDKENIKMVVQTGDMTHHNGTGFRSVYPDDPEYDRVKPQYDRIDDIEIPLLLLPGNHEYDYVWVPEDLEAYNYYFPETRYKDKEWYGGQYEAGKCENVWYKLNVRGVEYIFLSTEYLPRLDVLAWCNTVAEENPNSRIFYFSHDYLYGNESTGEGYLDSGADGPVGYNLQSPDRSSGGSQWREFVNVQPNIVGVWSGHRQYSSVMLKSLSSKGTTVTQVGHDYSQETVKDYLILLTVDPKTDVVVQSVYSPSLDQNLSGYAQDVTFDTKLTSVN
jgi:hypothetical protein